MQLTALTAISPVDGRYRDKALPLADYFSEYATIRYRVKVEVEYFIALAELPRRLLRFAAATSLRCSPRSRLRR